MTNSAETPKTEPTPLESRFFTAAAGDPPTQLQKDSVAQLRSSILQLATDIEMLVPPGRNKALALTHLEDVQMRANRGIFASPENR